MDFDQLVTSLGKQVSVALAAPIPFAVCVAIVGAGIWWVLNWRFGGIIARLENDVSWAKSQFERQAENVESASKPRIEITGTSVEFLETLQDPKPREFLAAPLSSLAAMRLAGNGIAGDRQAARFKGKWVEFEEIVERTGMTDHHPFVRATTNGDYDTLKDELAHSVTFWFRELSPELELLQPGDTIKGRGMISDVSRFGIMIDDCELA